MIFGMSCEWASRMTAAAMRVSAMAALCRGFFPSAMLTASGKVSGVPVCPASGIDSMAASAASRTARANAILEYRDEWRLRVAGIGMCETPNIAMPLLCLCRAWTATIECKGLHQQSDHASDHERCGPYQVEIEPRLAENREAELAINHPRDDAGDCKVGGRMDRGGE